MAAAAAAAAQAAQMGGPGSPGGGLMCTTPPLSTGMALAHEGRHPKISRGTLRIALHSWPSAQCTPWCSPQQWATASQPPRSLEVQQKQHIRPLRRRREGVFSPAALPSLLPPACSTVVAGRLHSSPPPPASPATSAFLPLSYPPPPPPTSRRNAGRLASLRAGLVQPPRWRGGHGARQPQRLQVAAVESSLSERGQRAARRPGAGANQ